MIPWPLTVIAFIAGIGVGLIIAGLIAEYMRRRHV